MKYTVKINDRNFVVEILDLHDQPVTALVDGKPVEIWVESRKHSQPTKVSFTKTHPAAVSGTELSVTKKLEVRTNGIATEEASNVIRAPIPGVIVNITAREGDTVEAGQELCVLEAMKMKNMIRSPRPGVISKILVSPGQSVQHHDTLMEFSE
jgi:biotin carboxyl carrier protein